jgi:aspartate aminotransferase
MFSLSARLTPLSRSWQPLQQTSFLTRSTCVLDSIAMSKLDLGFCPAHKRLGWAVFEKLYCNANGLYQAKEILNADKSENHEHLPLTGHPKLISGARNLVFGAGSDELARVATLQTISGTGSNHLGARLMSDTTSPKRVWISDPSWINHKKVWKTVNPSIERRSYPYHDSIKQSLNFDGMMDTLRSEALPGDVVILHACAHNPTGIDLSKEQWTAVADLCEEKALFPFFDLA